MNVFGNSATWGVIGDAVVPSARCRINRTLDPLVAIGFWIVADSTIASSSGRRVIAGCERANIACVGIVASDINASEGSGLS